MGGIMRINTLSQTSFIRTACMVPFRVVAREAKPVFLKEQKFFFLFIANFMGLNPNLPSRYTAGVAASSNSNICETSRADM